MKTIYIKLVFALLVGLISNSIKATEYPELLKNNCIECLELESLNNLEDESINIENWMTTKSFWDIEILNDYDSSISEDQLEIEGWMLDLSVKSNKETSDADENQIQEWMLDSKFMEIVSTENLNEIELKSWMFDADFWTI